MRKGILGLILMLIVAICLYAANHIRNSDAYHANAFYSQIQLGMSADAVEALTREYEYQWTYGGWNSLPTAERTPKYCAAGEYEILLIYGHAPSYPPEPQDMTVIGKRLRRCGDASFLESHLFPTPQKEGTVPKEWE